MGSVGATGAARFAVAVGVMVAAGAVLAIVSIRPMALARGAGVVSCHDAECDDCLSER